MLHRARVARWILAGHTRRPLPRVFTDPLADAVALEVGGPSRLFARGGLLPVYPVVRRVDGVQFAAHTTWHGAMDAGDYALPDGGVGGSLFILEGSELGALATASYDAVISSHVIEHFANPLGALREWRRIVRPGGFVLVVAPHKEGTFDHRRPTTTLAHLVDDEARGTGEDDLTHVEESIALHDHARDVTDPDGHAARCRDNLVHRTLHHHTFTTPSLLAMLDHAGIELLAVEARWPHDIYALGRFATADDRRPDNTRFLDARAPELRRSPFVADRRPR